MRLLKYILFLLLVWSQEIWSQNNAIQHNWDKVLYEVFSTQYDSLNNKQYIQHKEPFFVIYFDRLYSQELDSIMHECQILGNNPNKDSINNPQYMAKVKFCWVMMEMRMQIGIKQSLKERNEYYDSLGDTINIEFIKNGIPILLYDNFTIYYVLNEGDKKRLIEARVLQNAFLAPDIGTDTVGKVILEYEDQFYDITLCEYRLQGLKREIKLTLVFETKPYYKNVKYFVIKEVRENLDKRKDMKGVFYVSADRLGIYKYDYFQKKSDFFKEGRKIMKNVK